MERVQRAYDFLFPPACVFCSEPGAFVCQPCKDDLDQNTIACPRCAVSTVEPSVCGACLKKPPSFDQAIVPWRYAFPLDEALRRFKFHARLHFVPAFLELLAPSLPDLPGDVDFVQPMPLHWRRRASRGFNQAEELARPIARRLEVRLIDSVRRSVSAVPQSTLSRKDRQRSLAGHFTPRRAIPRGHILVVDDVVTTGATADALSRCLKKGGAERVTVLALARS